MAVELSIDTSTRYAGIGLSREGEALIELAWRSERNHTVELAPAVSDLLTRVGAAAKDLTALFVAQGPGNFSALRVGISYIKGLAMALHLPVVAVGTLEIEAAPVAGLALPAYALLDAGRGEVVWARFGDGSGSWHQETPERVSTVEAMSREVRQPAVICGEGALQWRDTLAQLAGERARIATTFLPSRRPSVLARLGYQRLQAGVRADVATLQPLYTRGPSITLLKPPQPIG